MQTFRNVYGQIIAELCNNIFDDKSKEYLKSLGLEYTADGRMTKLADSLFSEKVNEPLKVNTKFKDKEELLNLIKKDEYTGTIIQFGSHLSKIDYYIPSYITFLNKEIVYCQDSNLLSPAEHQVLNNIDIIRFAYRTGHREYLYSLFIKPQELVVTHIKEVNSYPGHEYTIIGKYTGIGEDERLFCATNEKGERLIGVSDNAGKNWFTIYDDGQKIEVKGTQNNLHLLKVKKTYLWNAFKLLQGIVFRRFSSYIAGIFTTPNIACNLFDGSLEVKGTENYHIKGKDVYSASGNKIVTFEKEPNNKTFVSFEMVKDNIPFSEFDYDVHGYVNVTPKTVDVHVGVPVAIGNKQTKFLHEFRFPIEDPHKLVYYKMENKWFYFSESHGRTMIEVSNNYFDEYEKELYKNITTRLCTAELSEVLEKESDTDAYSL